MLTSHKLTRVFLFLALAFLARPVFAQSPVGPGTPFPTDGVGQDQKPGSVLIYNFYSSSAATPILENTRINITNVSPSVPVAVHLFFVDGSSCSVADVFVCLTQNQTASFLASDFDPGVAGYLVAVAVDSVGCPVVHNYLIGDELIKLASGHQANLSAESFAAKMVPVCDSATSNVMLDFNGIQYDQMGQALALSNIFSRTDGNNTLFILNRPSGNLGIGADALGAVTGILYDDTENALSFTLSTGSCQFRASLSNNFPRTAPRFESAIPTGRSGWMKVFNFSGAPLTGAAINFNPASGTNASAFGQGHNLHKLRLAPSSSFRVPVFPPQC